MPTKDQVSHGADYYAEYHGMNGPLKVGWPTFMTNSSVLRVLDETFNKLGVPFNRDVNGGNMVGLTSHPDTLDREANERHDAARAYYWPYQGRPNLKIISNTYANKIIWADNSNGEAVAVGVELTGLNGVETIHASKEVILSAGALKSSVILELSGIGNPKILQEHEIPVIVNNSAVGENLQDQTNNGLSYQGRELWLGLPTFSLLPSADQLYGKNVSAVASLVNSSLTDYARTIANRSNGAVQEANLLAAFRIQYDLIFGSQVPFAEIVFIPIGKSFSIEYWPLLPFSRGSIHIKSADASQSPAINPNYFMFGHDLDAQVDVAQYIRNAFKVAPLSDLVGEEVAPGLDSVPENALSSAWKDWILSKCKCSSSHPHIFLRAEGNFFFLFSFSDRSNFHPLGTVSMLPREKGGVVSPELKVYGTKNVRVVDASVLPFQLCGHLSSTIYAVAERVSDLIKNDYL